MCSITARGATRRRIVRAALVAAVAAAVALPRAAQAQDWRTITSMRQFDGEDRLAVDVEYGAGRLLVEPAEPGVLYRAELRYDARIFRPELDYRNGRLDVGLDGRKGIDLNSDDGGRLSLALGPDSPIDLEMAFGAVTAEAELGGLRLRSVEISTGASETDVRFSRPNREAMRTIDLQVGAAEFGAYGLGNTNARRLRVEGGVGEVTLDFTGEWQRDLDVDIDMGLGSLVLRLPRGLGVRVTKDSFLASFDAQNFVKRGDVYYSENWDDAAHRLTIGIDAALSDIDVRWVGNVTARR